jgi:hypothetical protein
MLVDFEDSEIDDGTFLKYAVYNNHIVWNPCPTTFFGIVRSILSYALDITL